MTAPADLGAVAARLLGDGLPPDVDAWSRRALVDALAVTVGGVGTRVARAAIAAADRRPGPVPLGIVPGSASAEWAAFVWATAGNALDYDDGHVRGGGIHAGTTVAAALLATAPNDLPLTQLRAAFVIGCEIAVTAGALASPAHSGHDYRTSGFAAAIGGAAAVSAVIPLPGRLGDDDAAVFGAADPDLPAPPSDRASLVAATIRLAAAHAPVSSFISGGARESTGWAAATAVGTSELAAAGLAPALEESRVVTPAGPTLFDATHGLFAAGLFAAGAPFAVLETYQKPYPCCRAAHAALDAVLALVDMGELSAEGDTEIRIGLPLATVGLDERRPVDLGEAQFAVPFLVALAVAHGVPGLRGLGRTPLRELVEDAVIRRTVGRVSLSHDPELARDPGPGYPATVTVVAADGTARTRTVRHALGSAEQPLGDAGLREKTDDLLRPAMGAEASDALVSLCLNPPEGARVRDLRAAFGRHKWSLMDQRVPPQVGAQYRVQGMKDADHPG
ncbi:MmgE/PrpD family protein [Leucobacter rhizosphaerae]|uniref:MmgE/PrpD family protein n=1 Tax=Leucobacter rhizosphaerae TaxID=2932245 RepID=A0ABY4FU77_9MICO|nr:MmgE/PrpD family protein [Leucobacter rhizosphaerae]UOQ59714.1 MmgE/PrpD family protein [Leucobacter rhizosphaerae]